MVIDRIIYTGRNICPVHWRTWVAKPGTENLYNIIMMEELQTVVSVGGGGVTKLVDYAAGRIVRLPNPKYPHDYLTSLKKVLAQKEELIRFYGSELP